MRPLTAADENPEADLTVLAAHGLCPDVVYQRGRAVDGGSGDGDLEFARQERELRVQRRPLPDELAPGARVDDLVVGDAGERVACRVAHTIAAGLDGMHLDGGEQGEDFRNAFECRPVELNVLPCGEMPIAAVILARNLRERAQLLRGYEPIGNRDPEHRRMLLDVEAVLQAQRAKLVLRQLAGQETLRLVAELGYPASDQCRVECVVAVHGLQPPI